MALHLLGDGLVPADVVRAVPVSLGDARVRLDDFKLGLVLVLVQLVWVDTQKHRNTLTHQSSRSCCSLDGPSLAFSFRTRIAEESEHDRVSIVL